MSYGYSAFQNFDNEQFLSALSLDDKFEQERVDASKGNAVYNSNNDDDDFDDPMEIDDSNELNDSCIDTPLEREKQDFLEIDRENMFMQDKPALNSSMFSSLSPTMLGARLAVRKPLLLLPPSPKSKEPEIFSDVKHPTTRRKSSVDYEFDISSYQPVNKSGSFTKRNTSSIYNVDSLQRFVPSHDEGANYFSSASGLQKQQQQQQQQPQTVHHHHYYSNKDYTTEDTLLSHYKSRLKKEIEGQDKDSSRMHLQKISQTCPQTFSDLQLSQSDTVTLPAPWKSNISPIERIPYILSSYLQFVINFILSLYMLYLLMYIFTSIRSDINHKLQEQRANILSQIESCKQLYYENKCDDPDFMYLPLMGKKCQQLQKCMNQNPNSIGNLSVINAQIIGMVLNSLIEPLSFKFFIFVLWCGFVIFGCNFFFGYVRAKTYYGERLLDKRTI
ncbi:hypothetical protein KGF56_001222 [Candida oxycetoniae]|uniref:Brl1/Brr6 domain-containing protein n=1 Tax=Candida oxycetoniae TaxID=497107 RepID=A0AAI9SZG6_9ASCO|nr:uncharacterized protein KGF56_001222 [Candida oxycetoniae]KAI3406003.2 hypothetical protein KGF56_001222 [Candida oxycetoniae]